MRKDPHNTSAEKKNAGAPPPFAGMILVADDEEMILSMTKRMLTRLGFTVITATDGPQTLELFRKHRDEIVAVLLDMVMPKMTGDQVFREITAIRSDIPVIVCSGHGTAKLRSLFPETTPAGFVHKPYEMQELTKAIQKVLAPKA